jgi:uncharacterized protein (UPF0128 family)
MIIATYESKQAELPENRRWLAQIEKIKGRYYVCFHGRTEADAIAAAENFLAGQKPTETVDDVATLRRREVDDLA